MLLGPPTDVTISRVCCFLLKARASNSFFGFKRDLLRYVELNLDSIAVDASSRRKKNRLGQRTQYGHMLTFFIFVTIKI